MTERRLAYLDRSEITRRAPTAVVVLPLGATEQHGPHLATGTDHLIVEWVAEQAASAASDTTDVIIAPTIPFGFSAHHLAFGATISISTRTLGAFLEESCASLVACGFPTVFILNGHGGNDELVRVVARQVGSDTGAVIAAGSYWVIAWDRLLALGVQDFGRLPGHAGAFETALLSAARPDLAPASRPARPAAYLRRERYYPDVHVEDAAAWRAGDGFSDDPSAASDEMGHKAAAEIVAAVADALRNLGRTDRSGNAPPDQSKE
jgi:creatinine amidohydrolase